MTRKDVKEKILKFNQEAKEQAQKACSLAESISREEMIQCVHTYVCSKFFLDMSESKEKLLYQMAEQSIEKALQMKIPIAKDSEIATTCGMAGTAAMKVALLMVAVRKDFQVEIPPQQMAFIKNTGELGELIYKVMCYDHGRS